MRKFRGAAALVVLVTSVAHADDPPHPKPRVHWDAAWRHTNASDYFLAGVGTTVVGVELGVLQQMRPAARWTDPILFDSAARSAMRLPNASDRSTLEDVAWVLWGTQMAYPVLVDVPYALAHYDFAVARDLFWQDLVTMTVAGAIDGALRDIAGRVRPNVYDCVVQGGTNCLASVDSTRSFPGGHLVNSTAAAALTCTQHLYMRLYGAPWDAIACVTTLTMSAMVAVFRIMSDNHWASDQIVGAALGGLVGWGIPYLMHLHGHARGAPDARKTMVLPVPVTFDHGGGLGVMAIF